MIQSLKRQGSELALPVVQRETLHREDLVPEGTFARQLESNQVAPLHSRAIEILQINVGKVCNQTCTHCHVDAGPDRRENMSREIAELVVETLAQPEIEVLDITGGAPEMNPQFRWLVEQARALQKHVIDRCNLTILLANGFKDLPEFLAQNEVEIVASLPCYLEENCDAQRGDGVFKQSIEALQKLNDLGYGKPDSPLRLCLVYNPVGNSLPPSQEKLESDYRDQLHSRYGIEFTSLYTITNMPISRYLDDLLRTEKYLEYMEKLIAAFNPASIRGLMCTNTLSVDWQGYLFDCDFNQMLDLPVTTAAKHLRDIDWKSLRNRQVAIDNHCFGCTAGAGSSCQGAIA